ncbi:MAG: HAD hydrolase family protein [Proteobacteria bacterium]|jgi:3-deoxy-D-manno-octulosonate 8-phosphate phosphatase (KDO 8-P phosphatase)|nr:HAD hydrolase family protein [Pseudomonadota bacterium]
MEITQKIIEKAKKIKLLVSDVDGVLTQGELYFNSDGTESFGKFNIYDGFAVTMSNECNLKIAIISGRQSLCSEARNRLLGVDEVHTGVLHKKHKLEEIIKRLKLSHDEVAYIGDDLIDLPAIKISGLSFAPSTAVEEVKQRVDHITNTKCGEGVLREVVELILKSQDKYNNFLNQYIE